MSTPLVRISVNPFVLDLLTKLRDRTTQPAEFRRYSREIAKFLAYEAGADLTTLLKSTVETPLGVKASGYKVDAQVALFPILRAGLALVEGFSELLPKAPIHHLGLYRDEATAMPVHYYKKLEGTCPYETCVILDPMLATGGSAVAAAETLRAWGAKRLIFIGVIAAPEGIAHLSAKFPGIPIYVASIDECLNDRKYIVPGLGDYGDRYFGTPHG